MSEEDKNNDKNQDYCYLCRRTEKVAGNLSSCRRASASARIVCKNPST